MIGEREGDISHKFLSFSNTRTDYRRNFSAILLLMLKMVRQGLRLLSLCVCVGSDGDDGGCL